ncbi:MAG: histidine kinase [Bacteroidetes bacterium]|nr:histidine kinase [Bacteroidota bacterium]MBL6943377.1 histidine kinase [Bacteroidales bacterium]
MLNPISKNRNYIIAYIAIWITIFLIQTLIINFFYEVNSIISLTDSVIFNLLFALIGLNLWYVIRFNLKETPTIFDLLFNHFIVAVITIAIWITVSYFTLIYIFPEENSYTEFLNDSLPWRVITGIFYYLLFIMFYYVMLYYEDLQEKLKVEAELQALVNEAELSALKSQINPHFLFNSLNSISSLTITNPGKAQEMVIKLSDFLRYTLSHDKDEKASLKEEFGNLHRYLDIEKIRFGHRLNFSTNIPEECNKFLIPNMILQPLLENAIKHGVYNSTDEVLVELTCKHDKKNVIIEISNEYDPDSVKKKGEGIGLKNIRKRLQIIYKRHDLLEISAEKLIFRATLKLPIKA